MLFGKLGKIGRWKSIASARFVKDGPPVGGDPPCERKCRYIDGRSLGESQTIPDMRSRPAAGIDLDARPCASLDRVSRRRLVDPFTFN